MDLCSWRAKESMIRIAVSIIVRHQEIFPWRPWQPNGTDHHERTPHGPSSSSIENNQQPKCGKHHQGCINMASAAATLSEAEDRWFPRETPDEEVGAEALEESDVEDQTQHLMLSSTSSSTNPRRPPSLPSPLSPSPWPSSLPLSSCWWSDRRVFASVLRNWRSTVRRSPWRYRALLFVLVGGPICLSVTAFGLWIQRTTTTIISQQQQQQQQHQHQQHPVSSELPPPPPPPPPPLETLVANSTTIIGNVQFLLDFAWIGHSKCATTTQMHWLHNHSQILMYDTEIHSLTKGRPAEFVRLLYNLSSDLRNENNQNHQHPSGPPSPPLRKRGYKAPSDITSPVALQALQKYWPHTRLVVGVRHPVWWFESYINFVARQLDQHKRRKDIFYNQTAAQAIVQGWVSTHLADFHVHLGRLGKTPMNDPDEMMLLRGPHPALATEWDALNRDKDQDQHPVLRMDHPVFLYEATQPFSDQSNGDVQYRSDLQSFLGLTEPLPPIPLRTDGSPNYHYAIDLCDTMFDAVRSRLVKSGQASATWILHYFVVQPDVTVSSPTRFAELLQLWSIDPCVTNPNDPYRRL